MKRLQLFAFLAVFALSACGGSKNTPPPVITIASVSPARGAHTGNERVFITGANFGTGATVVFGGADATVLSVAPTQIIAVTPAHPLGTVDVVVKNPDNKSATLAGGFTFTLTQWELAEIIMGDNFFGPKDIKQYFGRTLTASELDSLKNIPFTKEDLEAKKTTHILVATVPLSAYDIYLAQPAPFDTFNTNVNFATEPFMTNAGSVGWHLVLKTPYLGSDNKSWVDQQALLSVNEAVPTVRVMTHAIIGHYLKTGVRLLDRPMVRTADTWAANSAYRAMVGYFDAVYGYWIFVTDLVPYPDTGIAAEWTKHGALVP